MINDFDSSLIKIDKKSYKNIGIYNIGYITMKNVDDYENINSVNPLYLIIGKADGCIEENNGNKKVLAKFTELWDEINILLKQKMKIRKVSMKKKFNSDDNLPLNKMLNLNASSFIKIIVRSVFEENGKYF